MIAAVTLKDMWQDIVESHDAGLSFASIWTIPLDEDADLAYPRAVWKEPNQAGVPSGANNILDTYECQVFFEDKLTSERTTNQRDTAHSDMSLVARECFNRFLDLYCRRITTFGGYDIDFTLQGTYTLTPYWDKPGTMVTGVALTFTLRDNNPTCVTDATFPLS